MSIAVRILTVKNLDSKIYPGTLSGMETVDAIDRMLAAWRKARPDLGPSATPLDLGVRITTGDGERDQFPGCRHTIGPLRPHRQNGAVIGDGLSRLPGLHQRPRASQPWDDGGRIRRHGVAELLCSLGGATIGQQRPRQRHVPARVRMDANPLAQALDGPGALRGRRPARPP